MNERNAKPVIFLAFANDRGDSAKYLRNLPEELRQVRAALESAQNAGLCELVERANATIQDIIDVFQHRDYRHRIAIFHYGGHANGFQLLLESPEGKTQLAHAGGLAVFLGQQNGLHLVFLNGCSTQQQVQGLLEAKLPAVIATSQAIDDAVATEFATSFYQGLGSGASLRQAYQEAAAAVRMQKGDNSRHLYVEDAPDKDRWPWELYPKDGGAAHEWSLFGKTTRIADGERRRLEQKLAALQTEWNLRSEKAKRLREALAIETDAAVKFKTEQQLKAEETQLGKLEEQITAIEEELK